MLENGAVAEEVTSSSGSPPKTEYVGMAFPPRRLSDEVRPAHEVVQREPDRLELERVEARGGVRRVDLQSVPGRGRLVLVVVRGDGRRLGRGDRKVVRLDLPRHKVGDPRRVGAAVVGEGDLVERRRRGYRACSLPPGRDQAGLRGERRPPARKVSEANRGSCGLAPNSCYTKPQPVARDIYSSRKPALSS